MDIEYRPGQDSMRSDAVHSSLPRAYLTGSLFQQILRAHRATRVRPDVSEKREHGGSEADNSMLAGVSLR